MKSSVMIGGDNGTRQANDFYPTPPDVTRALIKAALPSPPVSVWEPACGEGDMVRELAAAGFNVWGSDVVSGKDFLTAPPPRQVDWIVTNPPFKLAEAFIRRAQELSPKEGFAMLTKATFWQAKRRTKLFRDNPPALILALNWRPDFMGRGAPTMDFIWNVWYTDDYHDVLDFDTIYTVVGRD